MPALTGPIVLRSAFLLVDLEVVLLLRPQSAHAAHVAGQLVARGGQAVLVLHLHADRGVEPRAEGLHERRQRHDRVACRS